MSCFKPPPNKRWPLNLLRIDDAFQVDHPRDFNSAKSATSQFHRKYPSRRCTMRIHKKRNNHRYMLITRIL